MKTYEDGLNEAWEAARKIACEYDCGKLSDIFGTCSVSYVIERFTASEAIDTIEKYEKTKAEIKVGDEVTDDDGWNGVVTWISPDGEYLVVTLQDGNALRWRKESFKKTGRHFPQIAEILNQMQEEE